MTFQLNLNIKQSPFSCLLFKEFFKVWSNIWFYYSIVYFTWYIISCDQKPTIFYATFYLALHQIFIAQHLNSNPIIRFNISMPSSLSEKKKKKNPTSSANKRKNTALQTPTRKWKASLTPISNICHRKTWEKSQNHWRTKSQSLNKC